ncbi:hypothetical protein B5P43_35440 [Bacillus sp. SRB_336]|nr:hypothetical protein B5P43_35440 [Bacillus sp. SRB_336]
MSWRRPPGPSGLVAASGTTCPLSGDYFHHCIKTYCSLPSSSCQKLLAKENTLSRITESTEPTDELAAGSEATVREIAQQPEIWRKTVSLLAEANEYLQAFLAPLLRRPDLRILLTGAGTSAFVGSIAAPALSRMLHRRVDAVATTDLVSNPLEFLAEDVPTLLVSLARSGDSPESVAATELADQVLTDVSHLVLTCSEEGRLYRNHRERPKSCVFLMPPKANDQGFAMTSSFTSMLLSCLLILGGPHDEKVQAMATAAERLVTSLQGPIRDIVSAGHDRVVFLGSGPLAGLARESALKLLELTAGKVIAYHDTPLGFRHGPKAILNDKTLVLVYISSDPYTRTYDLDIIAELNAALPAGNVIAISSGNVEEGQTHTWNLSELSDLDDAFLAPVYVLFAQLMGLAFSLHLGLTPDNPFPDGNVNRVVKGVRIHPLTPAENRRTGK